MYTKPITPDELYHHGIKGQKWGIRRFQNYDGTLKNKAAKDGHNKQAQKYTPPKTKFGKRMEDNQVSNYKKQYKNLSEKEIRESVSKQNKTARNVLIGAGVVVGAAAAVYAYKKLGREVLDNTIKMGTEIHVVSDHPDRINAGRAVYAAVNKRDMYNYRAQFGTNINILGNPINKYDNIGKVNKKIKVAGNRTGEKVFTELMANNKDFANRVNNFANSYNKNVDYKNFNTYALLGVGADYSTQYDAKIVQNIRDTFYGELKKRGYGAVADINDTKYSGFNTKAAIIFDRANIATTPVDQVKRLTNEQIAEARYKVGTYAIIDALMHPKTVATGAAYASLFGIGAAATKSDQEMKRLNRQKKNKKK